MRNQQRLLQATQLCRAGKLDEAAEICHLILKDDPEQSDTWFRLGIVRCAQEQYQASIDAYLRMIHFRPKFAPAYNNLGESYRLQSEFDKAIACYNKAISLRPNYFLAHNGKAMALFRQCKIEAAQDCFLLARQMNPKDPTTRTALGIIYLLQGKFAEGWAEYEWRWFKEDFAIPHWKTLFSKIASQATAEAFTTSPKNWKGQSLDGQTILLLGEQGLGDTVQFIRYAKRLKNRYDCQVIVATHKKLFPLLQSCLGIDELVEQTGTLPDFDVFAPLLSLPSILHDDSKSFAADEAYLFAAPKLVKQWEKRLEAHSGFRVGIAWQGNPKHSEDHLRSIPLREFLPLHKLSGISLISLQNGFGTEQLEHIRGRLAVAELEGPIDSSTGAFMDTAAILKNLDLLITSDTAIAHVASALGTPVWLLLTKIPDWRWLMTGTSSAWYPKMRLFRQTELGDWNTVIQQVVRELQQQDPRIELKRPEQFRILSNDLSRLATTRHGRLLYHRHDTSIGHAVDRYGEYSEGEWELIQQLLRPGQTIVEAGANLGALTLPLSQLVGEKGIVYAFEPQGLVFQNLNANMALNGRTNVRCRQQALGEREGSIDVPLLDYQATGDFGCVSLGSFREGERVAVTTIDALKLSQCHFLKIDAEGMEASILKGGVNTLQTLHPLLYVKNKFQDRSSALITWMQAQGYQLYWHTPHFYSPDNFFGNESNDLADSRSINLLGIPAQSKANVHGLQPVDGPNSWWR